ncbi:MAG: hypothetical protein LAN84_09235 [Acidobacteriia bacterium]|nr:hypothetical protein [Terriglobia bacterium]
MPKRLLLLLALIGLAPVCRAADPVSVRISKVGLSEIFIPDGQVTWIQVDLRNTTQQALAFELAAAELALDNDARPVTETLRLALTLAPGEARAVHLPLHVVSNKEAVISVQAADAGGRTLGSAARRVPAKSDGNLIAMLCATPELCRGIRQTILLSGSPEEQTRKSGSLRLAQVTDAPPVWWAWSAAKAVIVGLPMARLSAAQREALELYLLNGGTIILLEDQLKDGVPLLVPAARKEGAPAALAGRLHPGFLESFRLRLPAGELRDISSGRLIRFPSASSQNFAAYFRSYGLGSDTPTALRNILHRYRPDDCDCGEADRTGWLMKRLGTSFRFPTFFEMLLWMLGYLLLIGVVNFFVLRRMGRPEWGWITIPAIAVVFSCALYLASARNRPRNFGLDEMTVYRMDSLSPLAITDLKIRVSAPFRSLVRPVLPGPFVNIPSARYDQSVDFGPLEERGKPAEFRIGDRWESSLSLRKWSFNDLNFFGYHRFPGTIYRDSAGRLHNETGISFEQAIVADHKNVFLLGNVPAGAVVDLERVPRSPYPRESGRTANHSPNYPGPDFRISKQQMATGATDDTDDSEDTRDAQGRTASEADLKKFEAEWAALPGQPFSVLEFIRGWSPDGDRVFSQTKAAFFGFGRDAASGASLRGMAPAYKARSLTVVTFQEWP